MQTALTPAAPTNPKAPTLAELQLGLQQWLMNGTGTFATQVRVRGHLATERRLAIYGNAYRARLCDALRDSYGHTAQYLGDEGFEALALDYVRAHPSTHPSLRWFGIHFEAWLRRHHPADPDVAELAALDWAMRAAFDGPDAEPLSADSLAEVPAEAWATLGLAWHPTLQRLSLQHNTLAVWQALDKDEVPPPSAAQPQPTELLVWRLGLQPHFRSLDSVEALAIDRLRTGDSFAGTCIALQDTWPDMDIAPTAGGLLRRWLDDGLVTGFPG